MYEKNVALVVVRVLNINNDGTSFFIEEMV
jgi:hypothetical protein